MRMLRPTASASVAIVRIREREPEHPTAGSGGRRVQVDLERLAATVGGGDDDLPRPGAAREHAQLKTVETIQLGLPAVATPLSCRGFTELPANFTLADSAADFARALAERVAEVAAGAPQRLDGTAFLERQRAALAAAIARGLAAARA